LPFYPQNRNNDTRADKSHTQNRSSPISGTKLAAGFNYFQHSGKELDLALIKFLFHFNNASTI